MPLAVPRAKVQGSIVTVMRWTKPWRQVSLKSWMGVVPTIPPRQPSLKNLTINHRQYLFWHSFLARIVSQARPLGLRAPPSSTAPLQSLYIEERSSFPAGLLAPLSLAVTWRNLESRALGALLALFCSYPNLFKNAIKFKIWNFSPFGR